MKKTLIFIPLGIGISSAIIYLFNIFRFKIISNSATLLQIISNLKIYLYISIGGFILYFLIKVIETLSSKSKKEDDYLMEEDFDNDYEPFEIKKETENNLINENNYQNVYIPNYDYVPMYNKNIDNNIKPKEEIKSETKNIENITNNKHFYCYNCGEEVLNSDTYCRNCGVMQSKNKNKITKFRKIIDVLEIVILILVLYFLVNMLFDYKEKQDPTFKSPFKVSVTK